MVAKQLRGDPEQPVEALVSTAGDVHWDCIVLAFDDPRFVLTRTQREIVERTCDMQYLEGGHCTSSHTMHASSPLSPRSSAAAVRASGALVHRMCCSISMPVPPVLLAVCTFFMLLSPLPCIPMLIASQTSTFTRPSCRPSSALAVTRMS